MYNDLGRIDGVGKRECQRTCLLACPELHSPAGTCLIHVFSLGNLRNILGSFGDDVVFEIGIDFRCSITITLIVLEGNRVRFLHCGLLAGLHGVGGHSDECKKEQS